MQMFRVGCGEGTHIFVKKIYTDIKMHVLNLIKYMQVLQENLKINLKQEEYKSNLFSKKFDLLSILRF